MRLIHHTSHHVLIHLGLFSGFALLIPVTTQGLEQHANPWAISPSVFFGGVMLIVISAFLMYRMKESFTGLLQSLGAMIFLPGALNVVSAIVNMKDVIASAKGITGFAIVQPVAEFYIEHSVPTVLSVAAVYLLIGGLLYWAGHKLEKIHNHFS